METDKPVRKTGLRDRLFGRGESVIASSGLAVVALLVAAVGATAWWTLRTQRAAASTARFEQVRAVANLLARSAESMLAADQLGALRSQVWQAARTYGLRRCRIVLPDGQVVAAADPARITAEHLPRRWVDAPVGARTEASMPDLVSLRYPLAVSGRGLARLEVTAGVEYPAWMYWRTQTGIGSIAALAMTGLLLVYRRLRYRLRAVAAIREALLEFQRGQTAPAALAVSTSLGAEAGSWNRLLEEREQMRKQLSLDRARESLGCRREAKGDLAAGCDALSQGTILVDEKGRAKFVNGAGAVFLKARRDDIVGADIAEFIHSQEVVESIRATAAGRGCPRTTVEVEQRDDGHVGVLRFSVRPVRRGDSAAAMIVIEDVTQQRVAEEARNAFVAQATHELRTPLTNIRLYLETALDATENDAGLRGKCLTIISQETRRLERMVGDVLSIAEIEAGSLKLNQDDVRLEAVFEELRADYEAQAKEEEIAVQYNLPPKLPVLQGDRDKIVLALHNLMGNALKYTPEGGQVTVTVEASADRLVVEVADTGIGIAEEELERIFEKFYRSRDRRVADCKGSGLGLTLAREVVRLHGGDITVESELDHGSTFTLTLPLLMEADPHEDSPTPARRGDRSAAGGTGRRKRRG